MTAGERQGRPDPIRGTRAHRDLDDVLRWALHAAVDHIEPADDGLTRILHRLTTPAVVRQATLLITDCVDLARLVTIWLEPAFSGAKRLRWHHHTGHRRRISCQAARAKLRPAGPWLRPALAVATVAAIVVLGAVVVGQVRQIVTRANLNANTGATTPMQAGTDSAGGSHGQSLTTNLTPTGPTRPGIVPGQAGPTTHRASCAPMSCSPSAGTAPTPSAAVTPSPTALPSQSPGPTPTPSKTNHGHHKPHPAPATSSSPGHKGHGGS